LTEFASREKEKEREREGEIEKNDDYILSKNDEI